MSLVSQALVVGALLRSTVALLVTDGSSCATSCGNVLDSTAVDEIACTDAEYAGTSAGNVFKNCITCESASTYSNPESEPAQSDLQAMLYNLRHAVSTCLFEAGTNPCITSTACEPLKDVVEYDDLAPNVTTYGYCAGWSHDQVPKCQDCLRNLDGGSRLTNYFQILTGACDLLLDPPATIPLEGDIFSTTTMVNVTAPTPTASFVSSARVGALDYGQIAGIAIGGVLVLLVIMGCGVVCNGKRRRKAYLRRREHVRKNWPSPQGQAGEMFETPVSQRPLHTQSWGDSPVSVATSSDAAFPRYFSPYTSQYNSPVSAVEGPGNVAWPLEKALNTQNIGVALSPDHERSGLWSNAKGKDRADERDGYELQEGVNSAGGHQYPYVPPPPPQQAPTLNHPGYGRRGPSPSGSVSSQ